MESLVVWAVKAISCGQRLEPGTNSLTQVLCSTWPRICCASLVNSALSHPRNRGNGDERYCMRAKNLLLARLTSWHEETQVLPWVGQMVGASSLLCVFFLVCNHTLLSLILYIQSEAFLMFGAQPQPPRCVHEAFPAVLDGSAN